MFNHVRAQVLVVHDTPSKTQQNIKFHTKKTHTHTINCVHKVFFYNRDLSKWTTIKYQNVEEHIEIWVLKKKKPMQIKRKQIH
jgi:hypothetical protein